MTVSTTTSTTPASSAATTTTTELDEALSFSERRLLYLYCGVSGWMRDLVFGSNDESIGSRVYMLGVLIVSCVLTLLYLISTCLSFHMARRVQNAQFNSWNWPGSLIIMLPWLDTSFFLSAHTYTHTLPFQLCMYLVSTPLHPISSKIWLLYSFCHSEINVIKTETQKRVMSTLMMLVISDVNINKSFRSFLGFIRRVSFFTTDRSHYPSLKNSKGWRKHHKSV